MHPTGSFHTRENNFDFLRFFAAALVLFAQLPAGRPSRRRTTDAADRL